MIRSSIAAKAVIRNVSSSMLMADLDGRPEHIDLRSRTFIVAASSLTVAATAAATMLVDVTLGELEKEI